MTASDLQWIDWALKACLLAGIGYIISSIGGLRKDVQTQNGRVTTLETWRPLHEGLDMERHEQEQRERANLLRDHQLSREGMTNEVKQTRENLHDVRSKMATRSDVEALRLRIDQLRDDALRDRSRRGEDGDLR